MTDPWYTAAFGAHYPLLYQHRDDQEAQRCLALLPQLVPLVKGPLLDLGCGDGRHLEHLAEAGHQVFGLDLSPHLLAAAAQRLSPLRLPLVRGDMRDLPFANQSLGVVLSLFTAFGYFGRLADNLPVINEVRRVLRPGGQWFLDYVDCDRVRRDLSQPGNHRRERELGPLSVLESRRLSDDLQTVEKDVVLQPVPGREKEALLHGVDCQGVKYTESVALFGLDQIEELAAKSGLSLVAGAGSYEGAPLGEGTRWLMVFKKNETETRNSTGPRE